MLRLKYLLRNLLVTVLLSSFSMSLLAQVDTAFWFAVPKLAHTHKHWPIVLVVSTLDQPATVNVTMPASTTPAVATFTVPANSSFTKNIVPTSASSTSDSSGLYLFECAHNTTSNKGLFIQSTAKINAYVALQQNNSEIYGLKGSNGLGTQFFIPMQYQYTTGSGNMSDNFYGTCRNAIEIIATEDNTTVHITPSVQCGSHPANQEFTVILNKGQVYCLASNSQAATSHLDGTIVTSDKPIAVDVSDDSVNPGNGSGNYDLVADQLVPENLAGSEYVVFPSPSGAGNTNGTAGLSDYAFVFALEDNTDVTIYYQNGSSLGQQTFTDMMRGDKQKYHFTNNNPIFITSYKFDENGNRIDKKVTVFQLTGAGNELGGTQLPQINCTGSNSVTYRPLAPTGENVGHAKHIFLNLLCDDGVQSGFLINNNPLPSSVTWNTVPGHTLKYCQYNATNLANSTSIRVTNSLGKFHMGVVDYHQNGSQYDDCSISYFSNYAPDEYVFWDTTVTHHDYCEGDTIRFAFDSLGIYINSIMLPSDSTVNYGTGPDEITEIRNVTPDESGLYQVYAAGNCANDIHIDSIYITVHPTVYTTLYDTICPGTEYFGPNNFYFSEHATAEPGTLRDSIRLQTVEFGCDSIVRLELTVRDSVFGEFSKLACNQYSWNGQTYTQSGDYTQKLTGASVHGCDSIVTLHLEIEEPEVTIVTSEDDFCEFGEMVLTAETAYEEYIWSTGETTQFISVTQPGLYSVTVTQGECQASDHYTVPTCEFHIYMPSSITPSRSDGLNDYLFLPEYVHRFLTDFQIEIYDRWGELIYWSNDMNFKWYGEKAHVSDVYVWVIRVKNQEGKSFVYRGSVTVL